MNIWIDQSGCIACGTCAGLCPEVFGQQDDGIAEVICQPDAAMEDIAREAAGSCPVSVIHVEEE